MMRKHLWIIFMIFLALIIFIYLIGNLKVIVFANNESDEDAIYLEQAKSVILQEPIIKKFINDNKEYDYKFIYAPADFGKTIQFLQMDYKNNRALSIFIDCNIETKEAHFIIPEDATFKNCIKAYKIALNYIKQDNGYYVYDVTYNKNLNKNLGHPVYIVYYNLYKDSSLKGIIGTSDFYLIDINTGKVTEDHSEP